MIKRTIDISNPSYLKIKNSQLVVEQEYKEVGRVPVEDIGVLLISHREVIITSAVTSSLVKSKAAIIHCDEKFMPCAYTLPLDNNLTHTAILRRQIAAKKPAKKKSWQKIVQAKIAGQAQILFLLDSPKAGKIAAIAKTVRSGDPENKEALAAQLYWPALFGEKFRRNPNLEGINNLLNYGYAVMRASVTRAICCGGLHPAIGIHHSNQYNAFCLADDLIEPLRPLVDWHVTELLANSQQRELFLSSETKKEMLQVLSSEIIMKQRKLPLMVALHEYIANVKRVLFGESSELEIPKLLL